MDPASHPLDQTHLDMLRDAKEKLAQAKLQIERAQRAGIDTAEMTRKVNELTASVQRLLGTYFPGQL